MESKNKFLGRVSHGGFGELAATGEPFWGVGGGGGLRGYPFGTLGKFDSRKRDFYNFFRCN